MNKDFLKIASGTDYKHDFDSVSAGLRYIMNTIQSSYDPEIGIPQSQFIANFITTQRQIDAARATSVYAFSPLLPNAILQEPFSEADVLTEYGLFKKSLANLDMADIGRIIDAAKDKPYMLPNTEYSVFAAPVSERARTGEHTEYTLASVFAKLTPTRKIALLIDSSCISFTSLLIKKALEHEEYTKTEDRFEFYIIHSVECDADPALKVNSLDLPGDTGRVSVFFLRDDGASVTYTNEGAGANLFSTMEYTLTRGANGDVDATIRSADGSLYIYEDVKRVASVRTASTEIMKGYIKQGSVASHYTILKRNGDWCQALSILDTQRSYTIYDASYRPTGRVTTLDALQKEGVEISLVTLDIVLLSYAITLGLDVFFTYTLKGPERNQNWLLYFQNSIRMAPERIITLFRESMQEFDQLIKDISGATRGEKMINAETKRQELLATVREAYNSIHTALNTHFHTPTFIHTFPEYYSKLHYLLDTVGRWNTLLSVSYAEYYAKLSTGDAEPKHFITDLYTYKQLYAKIVQIYTIEKEIQAFNRDIVPPPSYASGFRVLTQLSGELQQGKVPVRQTAGSKERSISSESLEQARELVFLPLAQKRVAALPPSVEVPADTSRTVTLAYKAFYEFLTTLGLQSGGGDKRVLPQLRARHMITVRPIATLPYAGPGQFQETLDRLGIVDEPPRGYITSVIDFIYTAKQADYDEKTLIAYVEACIDVLVKGLKDMGPGTLKRGRAVNVPSLDMKMPIAQRATAIMKEVEEEDNAFLLKKRSDFQLEPGLFFIDSDRHRNLIVDEYIVDSTMYEEIQAFVGTMTTRPDRERPYIGPTTPDEIHFVCIRLLDKIAEYTEGLYDSPQPAVAAFVHDRLNGLYEFYKGFRGTVTDAHIRTIQALFVPFRGDTSIDESILPEAIASLERMILQLRFLVVFRYYAIRYTGMVLDRDVMIRFVKNICPTDADIEAVKAFVSAQEDAVFPNKVLVLEACTAAKGQQGGRRKYTRTRRRSHYRRRRSQRR
jgi:hypothetical protein